MTRAVAGLIWARTCERPLGLKIGRPRGAKASGIRYENAVARALGPQARQGLWWEYSDKNGMGFCQTDVLLEMERQILVLECKYTWKFEAWAQLFQLYVPVLEMALGKECLGVQVCKVLVGKTANVCWTVEEALTLAQQGKRATLHWTGNGPLGTQGKTFQRASLLRLATNEGAS